MKERMGERGRERERRLDHIEVERGNHHRDLKRVSIYCLRSECRNQTDAFDTSVTKAQRDRVLDGAYWEIAKEMISVS